MTDCIRSLLINCIRLKELFILSNITFHFQSYLKIFFFQLSPMHFYDFYILSDLQGNWNKFSIINFNKIIKLKFFYIKTLLKYLLYLRYDVSYLKYHL